MRARTSGWGLAAGLVALLGGWLLPAAGSPVEPQLTLYPSSGAVGDPVAVSGTGWFSSLSGPVQVFADSADSADPTRVLVAGYPNDDGSFSLEMTVPEREPGDYVFYACQACDSAGDPGPFDTADFTITGPPVEPTAPVLDFDPVLGQPGDSVTASGSGWSAKFGDVTVYADRTDAAQPDRALGSAPVVGDAFTLPVTVPDVLPGPHRFFACQLCGSPREIGAEGPFSVDVVSFPAPVLTVAPPSGRSGSSLTVAGSAWAPDGGRVSIFLGAPDVPDPGRLLGTAPQTGGEFRTRLRVPPRRPGTYRLHACQRCGQDAAVSRTLAFTVLAPPRTPATLTVRPARGQAGDVVTVSGAGWRVGRGPVRVFASVADSSDPGLALVVVDPGADGTFRARLEVPEAAAGDRELFACQACGDPAGFPLASAPFRLEGADGGPGPLPVVVAVLIAAGALLLRARRRPRPPDPVEAGPTPPGPITFRPHPDPHPDVRPGPGVHRRLPTVRLVPHAGRSSERERTETSS